MDDKDSEDSEDFHFLAEEESASHDENSDEGEEGSSSDAPNPRKRSRGKKRFNRGPRRRRTVQSEPVHYSNDQHPVPSASFHFGDGYICRSLHHEGGSQCTVLNVFGLFYASELGSIVCKTLAGGCLIPADSLVAHLKSHHSKDLGLGLQNRPPSEWARISDHILVAHRIDPKQTSVSLLHSLPTTLQHPLPVKGGVDSKSVIAKFYKCPSKGCRIWAIHAEFAKSGEYNIRRHYKEVHRALFPTLQHYSAHMVQKIQVLSSGGQMSSAWFRLPDELPQTTSSQSPLSKEPSSSAQPLNMQPSKPMDERITQATWMIKLGWVKYLKSLGEDMVVETLMQLAAPLGGSFKPGTISTSAKHLELGLRVLEKESMSYFMNSNEFLNSRHEDVRSVVAARCISFSIWLIM